MSYFDYDDSTAWLLIEGKKNHSVDLSFSRNLGRFQPLFLRTFIFVTELSPGF